MQNDLFVGALPPQMMHIPIAWAKAEGWNPGLEDALSFYAADNQGFWAGYLGDKVIATISAVNYHNQFGFIGFYIVDPNFRGQGFGRQIWDSALARLAGLTIGLDGVVEQQDFYRRSGFELAHRNIRYQGISPEYCSDNSEIIRPRDIHYAKLLRYDTKHFGCSREEFLQAWLLQRNAETRIIIKDGEIRAFGVIRKCFEGYKIGPLFADDYYLAEDMLQALLSTIPPGSGFFLDIPEPNCEARQLVSAYAMSPVFETARMYKGAAPKLPLERIFGITSFELG
jgi:ribosomal protein S18 acetylase RimI-like enzyme